MVRFLTTNPNFMDFRMTGTAGLCFHLLYVFKDKDIVRNAHFLSNRSHSIDNL